MTRQLVTHPKCRKSWLQRGNRTGHCAMCHETFEGSKLFDAHLLRAADGSVSCRDPRTMTFNGAHLAFDDSHGDGSGRAPSTIREYHASRVVPSATTPDAPVTRLDVDMVRGFEAVSS